MLQYRFRLGLRFSTRFWHFKSNNPQKSLIIIDCNFVGKISTTSVGISQLIERSVCAMTRACRKNVKFSFHRYLLDSASDFFLEHSFHFFNNRFIHFEKRITFSSRHPIFDSFFDFSAKDLHFVLRILSISFSLFWKSFVALSRRYLQIFSPIGRVFRPWRSIKCMKRWKFDICWQALV